MTNTKHCPNCGYPYEGYTGKYIPGKPCPLCNHLENVVASLRPTKVSLWEKVLMFLGLR